MGHYFDPGPTPNNAEPARRSFRAEIGEDVFRFVTAGGVFSPKRIDPGTLVLLAHSPRPDPLARNIVDLGCGYGPIALALARAAPDAVIWAIDVNERALDLCSENAKLNNLTNIRTLTPDRYEFQGATQIDAIWSNPPIRIGKKTTQGCPQHLDWPSETRFRELVRDPQEPWRSLLYRPFSQFGPSGAESAFEIRLQGYPGQSLNGSIWTITRSFDAGSLLR